MRRTEIGIATGQKKIMTLHQQQKCSISIRSNSSSSSGSSSSSSWWWWW
jgi:hypothetical protein